MTKHHQGVSYGANAIPVQALGGGQSLNARPSQGGVDYAPDWIGCQGETKDGNHCKANPAKDTDFCIGHLRANQAADLPNVKTTDEIAADLGIDLDE